MKAKIALIRCGMTESGEAGRFLGAGDEPLSPKGREAVARMARDHQYPPVPLVYTGETERCRQTTHIAYPRTPAVILRELRPYDYGDFTGKTLEELAQDRAFQEWAHSDTVSACPGGEGSFPYYARSTQAFLKIVGEMNAKGLKRAAIVTHNTAISAILGRFCVPRSAYRDWETGWGRGYMLEHDSRLSVTKILFTL